MPPRPAGSRRVLIAHPSAELYGSDRVAVESVAALVKDGWDVVVTLTGEGPLRELLEAAGARVTVLAAPVLRKAFLSPRGLLRLLLHTVRATPPMLRVLRDVRPSVVYVSTVTVPWWLVLARLRRARVICHVHEAEEQVPRPVRMLLAAPLLLAHRIVTNSRISRDVIVRDLPLLAKRTQVIYNGVPGPEAPRPLPVDRPVPLRLVLVGRVSPRKGTDVAVQALGLLRERGLDATLDLVGGVFPGYEWFEEDVRTQVREAGLEPYVRWRGALPDVWTPLAEADIALVPSRVEPFGNAAVEAMLAGRPLVAGDTQGLREIIDAGRNGELATPGDADSLAEAVARLAEDWPRAVARAEAAQSEARARFAPQRYRDDLTAAVRAVAHR